MRDRVKRRARSRASGVSQANSQESSPLLRELETKPGSSRIVQPIRTGSYPPTLWFRLLQSPVDELFAPYYKRAFTGDVQALVEFYIKHAPKLTTAFYECIGYLATTGSPPDSKVVRRIMNISARGGPPETTEVKLEWARHWYRRLLPVAQETKKWIRGNRREAHQKGELNLTRIELWQKYLNENLHRMTLAEIPGLITEFEFDWDRAFEKDPAGTLATKESQAWGRTVLRNIARFYLNYGLAPRTLFFELAESTPKGISPSTAARRFACVLAGVSESLASRKNLRKN